MAFYYKIYGLVIRSEIEFPEADEIEKQEPQVVIRYGIMPEQMKKKLEQHYNTCILFRKFKWFYVEKEGHFLIENGTDITVEPEKTADIRHIRSILLGGGLGSILYQREIVAIHGAAVVWKDKAIIVSGCSGSGKSTVTSAFRKNGCLFLADDTVAVTIEDGTIYANPSFPQMKLCTDAAAASGYDLDKLILLEEDCEKYAVRLKDTYSPQSKEIAAIVFLDVHEEDRLIIKETEGNRKLQCILDNLYGHVDYKSASMNINTFKRCLEMAQKLHIYQVYRPADKNVAPQIVEQIIERIDQIN